MTNPLLNAFKNWIVDLEDRSTWVNDSEEPEYLGLFLFFRCLNNFRRDETLLSPFEEGFYQLAKTSRAWLILIKCRPEEFYRMDNLDWELSPRAFRLLLNRNYDGKCAPWELRWHFDPDSREWVSSPSFP